MKIIKFDLPINGIKAKNLEELRDNLTDEIVGLARSGQLARWFTSRQWEEKAKAVAAAVSGIPKDKALFLSLCEILEIEAHPDDVNTIFDNSPKIGFFIKNARYFELYEKSIKNINELENKNTKSFENYEKLKTSSDNYIKELESEIYDFKKNTEMRANLILKFQKHIEENYEIYSKLDLNRKIQLFTVSLLEIK